MCRLKRQNLEKSRCSTLLKHRNKPNYFWKYIKKQIRSPVPWDLETTNKISGQQWHDYFQNLFSEIQVESQVGDILSEIVQFHDSTDLDKPLSNEEMLTSVRTLRGSCATGIDCLCMEMFKCTIQKTLPYLQLCSMKF